MCCKAFVALKLEGTNQSTFHPVLFIDLFVYFFYFRLYVFIYLFIYLFIYVCLFVFHRQ